MYSNDCINEYLKGKKTAPKVYIEQRMSVDDNEDIHYYLYTILEEGRTVSHEDIDDLVIIPDEREMIVGDFNCTDKKLSVLKVVKAIKEDQGITTADMPILKTPVWSYKKNVAKLAV